jgi:hypothetical protein
MPDRIDSWADLQAKAARILKRLNADERLGLAAAANPMLALERLGYVVAPEARPPIADRLRLGPEAADTLIRLRSEIAGLADRAVDPDDPKDLRQVLIALGVIGKKAYGRHDLSPPRWRPGGAGPDPLEDLRDRHPVMAPLLEYRRVAAQAPAYAPSHVFARVVEGELTPAVAAVTGRLHRGNERGPEHTTGRRDS